MTDFITILKLIFLSTGWCVGIYMNSEKGDAFYFLRQLVRKAPNVINLPVIGCINCMASFHTAVVMVIYKQLIGFPPMVQWKYLLLWLVVAVVTAGFNGIVYNMYLFFVEYVSALETKNVFDEKFESDD